MHILVKSDCIPYYKVAISLLKVSNAVPKMLNPIKNNDIQRFKTRVFPSKQSAVRKYGNFAQLQSFENQILAK